MDALGDDVFGEPVSAPPPQGAPYESELIPDIDDALPTAGAQPYAQELDMSDFGQEQAQPIVPGIDPATPLVPSADPVVQLSIEDTQAAFIGGYTPNPIEQQVIPPSPTANDPRTAWRKKNQEGLAKKDKEEAAAKKAAADKAKSFVTKFVQDRSKHLDTTKKTNRQAEKASPESGVPPGATWEKVTLLINFQRQDKAHVKDMSRFKACLQTCKTLNVPVATR